MVLDLFGVEVDPTVFFGLVLPIILFLFLRLQKNRGSHEMCELHSYQKAFSWTALEPPMVAPVARSQ